MFPLYSRMLIQHSFLASRFLVHLGDAITLVSFPHLLDILYLMLLFILTAYGRCSNSKVNTSEYVFNCLQNKQWGGFRKPMTGFPPLLLPLVFLFGICCRVFQAIAVLERDMVTFHI